MPNSFERPPILEPESEPLLLYPLDDAARLYDGDVVEINDRVTSNAKAIREGRFGEVTGPSFRLGDILDRLKNRNPADIEIIKDHLNEVVENAYLLKPEVERSSNDVYQAIVHSDPSLHSPQPMSKDSPKHLKYLKQNWTPYQQFASLVGELNKADTANEALVGDTNYSFNAFGSREGVEYQFEEEKLPATANGLVFNILFDADHQFRNQADYRLLSQYVEHQLEDILDSPRRNN